MVQEFNMADLIDYTNLKPDAKIEDIKELCNEATKYKFKAVCVNPAFVKLAVQQLYKTNVKICTVVGFPLGATTSRVKAFEAQEAVENGAHEIDMVINISVLKAGDNEYVLNDIKEVVNASGKAMVKVIIETCLLTDEEKRRACQLALQAGAHFVKTSTGFSHGGATVEDIALMRSVVGKNFGVKASGGIKDKETFLKMVKAGAGRIGTSSGVKIMIG